MSSLLVAIKNIIENPVNELVEYYKGTSRANNMGDALEKYVKDAFCGIDNTLSDIERDKKYSQYFSYLGNSNNPPDLILKNGDAVEVKKNESLNSAIALNSSYPKSKLYVDDSRITVDCKKCEDTPWLEKDIIYVIGYNPKNTKTLRSICFIYGDCYAASKEIYTQFTDKISQGIQEIEGIELVATNELAKVKKVDPLGITDLRVRGMWHIESPMKVYKDFFTLTDSASFSLNAIILLDKYNSFPEQDRFYLEQKGIVSEIEIKSPNNPAKLLKAKLISYEK